MPGGEEKAQVPSRLRSAPFCLLLIPTTLSVDYTLEYISVHAGIFLGRHPKLMQNTQRVWYYVHSNTYVLDTLLVRINPI